MTKTEINMINTTSLAYLGDAVYEVIVREMILAKYPLDAGKAHRHAVRYVSAGGQAKAARAMIEKGFLTEDAEVGDEVTVETVVGRLEKGTLIDDAPYYDHDYGHFVPELIEVDKVLRKEMAEIGGVR